MIGRMKSLSLPIEYTKCSKCNEGLISWEAGDCYYYSTDSSKNKKKFV